MYSDRSLLLQREVAHSTYRGGAFEIVLREGMEVHCYSRKGQNSFYLAAVIARATSQQDDRNREEDWSSPWSREVRDEVF